MHQIEDNHLEICGDWTKPLDHCVKLSANAVSQPVEHFGISNQHAQTSERLRTVNRQNWKHSGKPKPPNDMEDIDKLLNRNKPKPASADVGATGAAAGAGPESAGGGEGGGISSSGDFPAGTVPAHGESDSMKRGGDFHVAQLSRCVFVAALAWLVLCVHGMCSLCGRLSMRL